MKTQLSDDTGVFLETVMPEVELKRIRQVAKGDNFWSHCSAVFKETKIWKQVLFLIIAIALLVTMFTYAHMRDVLLEEVYGQVVQVFLSHT